MTFSTTAFCTMALKMMKQKTKGDGMPEIQLAEIISAEWHSPELHLGEYIQ